MAEQLNETIATVNYDNLFYSQDVAVVTSGVVIASGQGELKRGTILAKNSDNKMVILGTEGATADCVLCDDVTATDDTSAVAYVTGHFNIGAVTVADNYEITEEDTDTLRTKGILLGKMV